MLTIPNNQVIYSMSPDHAPVAKTSSGSTVCFETLDCFSNQIKSEKQSYGLIDTKLINPATGPLYIEDACPGDTLKVEILSIDVDSQAITPAAPGSGLTGCQTKKEKIKILPIDNGKVIFNDHLSLPLRPMIGVIGTAPKTECIPTCVPSFHGGNMDCKQIIAGSTLYLPVFVEGALLALGDLHAVMGDGEVCGCGAEISGKVTVRVTVVKNVHLPLPLLKTDNSFMTIYSDKNLDTASSGATLRMRDFLINQGTMEGEDADILLSLAGNLRICQVVDPQITCRMELPLSILSDESILLP